MLPAAIQEAPYSSMPSAAGAQWVDAARIPMAAQMPIEAQNTVPLRSSRPRSAGRAKPAATADSP